MKFGQNLHHLVESYGNVNGTSKNDMLYHLREVYNRKCLTQFVLTQTLLHKNSTRKIWNIKKYTFHLNSRIESLCISSVLIVEEERCLVKGISRLLHSNYLLRF